MTNDKMTNLSQKAGYIPSSILILIAFSAAFFPRILEAAGAPSAINFLHFAVVPLTVAFVIIKTRTKDPTQIVTSRLLLSGMLILFGVMTASALLNKAGVINLVLDFLLLAEPFMLLLAIICIPISPNKLKFFRRWLVGCCLINLVLAYIQWPLLHQGLLPRGSLGVEDAVQGVFYLTTAGNYISASISVCFSLYYFTNAKLTHLWWRISLLLVAAWQLIISDSKQTLLAFAVAWLFLLLTQLQQPKKSLSYLIGIIVAMMGFLWCVENLPSFSAFAHWLNRLELYGPNGEATLAKTAGLRIIPTYYEYPLHWLFGLGPGHTIGRLGGWMLEQYSSLLSPLGATVHPASQATWDVVYASWVAKESTMFSPFFGWAAIWGDLGFFGLGAYLYLGYLVWHHVCQDDLARFWLLSIFVVGLIFTQMEEPGYMLSMAMFIGLRWHESKIRLHVKRC
ncbi:MAG: hypothetical protein WBM44_09480 [Waterburya sp.]